MFLCLDFDGVVVDGANECLIVSWLAWNKQEIPDIPEAVLKQIPTSFKEMFKLQRNYIRFDGHFIVPYVLNENSENIINGQSGFEKAFSKIKKEAIDSFTVAFQETRRKLRSKNPDAWFNLHTVYPGIKTVFNSNKEIFIISGKDKDSIRAICDKNNLLINSNNIWGSLKSKIEVLEMLFKQAKEKNSSMVFCDDNLPNILESKILGISTIWAGWGYNTQEHIDIAKEKSIIAYTVTDFIKSIEKTQLLQLCCNK